MPYMLASGLSRPGMSGSIVAMYNNCERKFTPIGVNSGQMSLSDGSSSELCIVWQWALVEEMIRLQLSDGNASVEILQHACCQPGVGDVDLAQLMPN